MGHTLSPKKQRKKGEADTYIILNIPSTNVTALQVIHLHKITLSETSLRHISNHMRAH